MKPKRITLDQMDGAFEADTDDRLGEVLAGIESYLSRAGRVLSTVRLDGEELDPERRAQLAAEPVSAFAQMELESVTSAVLALETLAEVRGHLPLLTHSLADAARAAQMGRLPAAAASFTDACEGWTTLLSAMERSTAVLGVGADELRPRWESASVLFTAGRDAIADGDIAAFADIAAFELVPAVAAIVDEIRDVAGVVKSKLAMQRGGDAGSEQARR